MIRWKWLSAALGVGLAVASLGTASAQAAQVDNDPVMGQSSDQVNNQVEQNGRAFDGDFGAGQLEDDESNGSIMTGNDAQGDDDDDDGGDSR